jgi:subtilisin family serine protease
VACAVGLALAVFGAASADAARYIIEHPAANGDALVRLIEARGGTVVHRFRLVDGLVAELSGAQARAVRRSGLATAVSADGVRSLHMHLWDPSTEITGYGVARVRATDVWSTDPANDAPDVAPGANAGGGVVVGVLDTGVDFGHPDLAANLIDVRGSGVVRDFVYGDDDPSADEAGEVQGHGTEVSSTIAAVDNGVGAIGVAPQTQILPYRVCFPDRERACPTSAILGGLEQAILDEVDVINLSLGGPAGFNLEARLIQLANQHGIVVVASAGNEGNQKVQFPAGYDTVLAVGATDADDRLASFSSFGGWVDLVAPGVAIPVSTVRGIGRDAWLAENSPTARTLSPFAMAGTPAGNVTADLVYVGLGTADEVDAACAADACVDKVALISRGAITFGEKVANAEEAGAIGTIVFNNRPGNFLGTLGGTSDHPSVSISDTEGAALLADVNAGPTNVTLEVTATDYDLADGTSFSSPHVAGVAALVLAANPALKNSEVREILEKTCEPIGPQLFYGRGMVNAEAAVAEAQGP